MSEHAFLEAKHINKSFGGVQALKNVSLHIASGEVLCLIGENGSGKSTLIKVISGIHRPDSGEIFIEGRKYEALTPMESVRAGIQVIYQDFSLFPNLTVAENIAGNQFLAENRKLANKKRMRQIAAQALAEIDISLDLEQTVEELSVAEKQLVAIARAILQDARLIIMDEPTTALTAKEVEKVFVIVEKLKSQGCAIIFVSHKLDEVKSISERIMVLRNGELVIEDAADHFDMQKLAYYISGRDFEPQHYDYVPQPEQAPVLEVKNLGCGSYFQDVSFALHQGEILGITGLLGSGRTELALALFGALRADQGTIERDGRPVEIKSIQDAVGNSIGYVPEDRLTEGLFLEDSIEDNIIIRILNETNKTFVDRDMLKDSARGVAERLAIKMDSMSAPVKSLSGGNQQRVVLAKWLSILPKILILNGPTVGVDIGSKAEIHQILRELAAEGMSLIVISDDISELMQTCNRIFLMNRGRLSAEFQTREISEQTISQQLT